MSSAFYSRVRVWILSSAFCIAMSGPLLGQTHTDVVATKKPVKLTPVVLDKAMAWQAEPGGPGELLPFAGTPIADPLRWGAQTFAGTATGLLYSTPSPDGNAPTWSMLPELYGQEVRPIGDMKGQLVVQKGKPFSDSTRLVFLDTELKVVRELPGIHGYCFGLDAGGFWVLDDYQNKPPTSFGPATLVYYDDQGQELRRAHTDGTELPTGQVHWAAVGTNAVWLAIFNIKSIGENGPEYTSRQMVRLDPETWKAETVDITAPAGSGFANLPERIVWLEPAGSAAPGGAGAPAGENAAPAQNAAQPAERKTWVVQQLDKKTLEVAKAGEVELNGLPDNVIGIRSVFVGDKALWLVPAAGARATALALDSFKIVDPKSAGTAPTGIPPNSYSLMGASTGGADSGINLLDADRTRLWLLTGNGGLVAIADDGVMAAAKVSEFLGAGGEVHGAAAMGGGIYLMNNAGALLRVEAGSTDATELSYARYNFQPWLVAGTRRLWLTNYRYLLTLAPDDHDRLIDTAGTAAKPPSIREQDMVAVDDDVYYFQWSDSAISMVLWRGDARLNRKYAEASWFKMLEGVSQRNSWVERVYTTAHTPDNRILYFLKVGEEQRVAIFDPRSKDWKQVKVEEAMNNTVTGAGKLLGFNSKGAFEWRDDNWQPLGNLPEGLKPTGRVLGTAKYLYAATDNGLYRVAWDKLKPAAN